MSRRGVTLIELLIGLVLLAMLGIAITSTLAATSRATRRALQGLASARTLAATGALLREELGSSDMAEVQVPSPTAVNFSRAVGSSVVCAEQGNAVLLVRSEWLGVRWPEAGRDEAVVLTDVVSGRWSAAQILAVGLGQCPDGSPAILVTLGGAAAGAAVFVRVIEPVQLRGYLSGGTGWWGLAPADGLSPAQPFAGPLEIPLPGASLATGVLSLPFHLAFGADSVVLRVPLGTQ